MVPLARFLGADECIASRARLDEEGRYTGKMQFYAFGPFKAEAMDALAAERGIDLAASYAYTDSYTDLPMLEAVGHPVAVNPDARLATIARRRGWLVEHWKRASGGSDRFLPIGSLAAKSLVADPGPGGSR